MSTWFLRLVGALVLVGMLIAPALSLAAPNTQGGRPVHVVQAGETLAQIAARYGVSVAALVTANNLKDANIIYVGQQLVIPAAAGTPQATQHWVNYGETLSSIAAFYGVTVAELAAANGLAADATLYAGQVLVIPIPTQPVPGNVVCGAYHTVQAMDTLSGIAARYGISLSALIQANRLDKNMAYLGQQLCIPAAGGAPPAQPVAISQPTPIAQPAVVYQPTPLPPLPTPTVVAPPPPEYVAPVPSPALAPAYVPPAGSEPAVIRTQTMWVGSQTNDTPDPHGITSLVVLTNDKKGLNVTIRSSSGFMGSGTTGEYYEFSWVPNFAFRYIPAGSYQVWIEGEPSKVVTAEVFPGRRTWVEFKWRETTPDVVMASASGWTAEILENTSTSEAKGVSSILIVKTGAPGQQVRVTAPGGFEGTCTTGSKPEHGPGACDIGGLSAGTYTISVSGVGVSLELYLDGQGYAVVAFHPV